MRDIVYFEWVPAGIFVKIIVGFVSLLALFVLFITIAVGVAIQNPFWIVITGSALVFLLLLFRNYRGIQIQVTAKELLINYGFFHHKRIPIVDIVSCEPTKANFGKYLGVGIRYGTDGSWAYTTSFGNAVKIVLREERPFVFSSNNPEKICSIVNQIRSTP